MYNLQNIMKKFQVGLIVLTIFTFYFLAELEGQTNGTIPNAFRTHEHSTSNDNDRNYNPPPDNYTWECKYCLVTRIASVMPSVSGCKSRLSSNGKHRWINKGVN